MEMTGVVNHRIQRLGSSVAVKSYSLGKNLCGLVNLGLGKSVAKVSGKSTLGVVKASVGCLGTVLVKIICQIQEI